MRPEVRKYAAAAGRWVLICTAFGVVFALVDQRQSEIARGVLWVGERVGAHPLYISGAAFSGANGPFAGSGTADTVMNWVFRWAAAAIGMSLGWLAATVVRMLLHRWLPARGAPRDGRTRCGRCGYHLSGLSKPVCPECGLVI
ncbi:MAG: hypothetical protein NTV94_02055 [Planctomycetota bacterium]|nr:hypothetical protein [Planctomycetota bacterium]